MNPMVTTNRTPIIDTQKLKRKKHKHTTKNHQITKVETKRRGIFVLSEIPSALRTFEGVPGEGKQ